VSQPETRMPQRRFLRHPLDLLRPSYDGPVSWLWMVGSARIAVLFIVAIGTNLTAESTQFLYILAPIYFGAMATSLWYLFSLRRQQALTSLLTWTQMIVDFGVVAATISFTEGESSFFTFLLVIVILEAGVLMGLLQGFLFATMASSFMLFWFTMTSRAAPDILTHWYTFLIQCIAFFFTAFISGYWNQRVSRMKHFQREILDNMSSGFLITDARGLVIAINHSACQILGLQEGNVAGRHVDGIIRPEADTECPVTTALRLQKDFASYEFYARTGDDLSKLLGLTTNRIRDAYGHITGLIASFTDLTEMDRMRRELQQQDRMAAIGELSAGLAHEIRNPVASIRGAMDELRRNIENPRMIERLANIAIRESDHLNEIVSGFLDFARDPSKKKEVFDVREVVNEVAGRFQREYAEEPKLTISAPEIHDPCPVVGDPTQIRQVVINLCQNAIDAMHGEGALTITIHPGRARPQKTSHGPIEIRFEDTGPGIAPDKVARIFEPFYTEKERGVGMGLAICMRIINAHNGTIQVASRPGGGTSMSVRLPAANV
jgi:two-component system, NtrC family, sensor histidine kinase PilS